MWLWGACYSPAQEFRASIIGQVFDASGAPIPGAAVIAVELSTNQAYTTKSNADGVYSVDFLQPGHYTLTVEAQGMSKQVFPDVTLQAVQKLNLNVTLTVGTVNQQVTVSASPGLIDTATASGGGVVDQAKVENMTSMGRQSWDDVEFVEGARMVGTSAFNLTLRNNSNAYTINGAPTTGNSYFLNGAPVSTTGSWHFSPNQDVIEELQVSASGGAQYGPAQGGVFNTVIKAGTNKFHGEVYDFYGNEVFNANYLSANATGIPRGVNIRNTYGGNAGGPVRKNKTFFFFGFEGFHQITPSTLSESVPTAAMRGGNFAGTGYTVYDPTTVTCVTQTSSGCSTYSRSAFPDDTVPQSRISTSGGAAMSFYPNPNGLGVLNNYLQLTSAPVVYKQYIGRVDHSFSDSTRLYGLFTKQSNYTISPNNDFNNVASTMGVPTGNDYNGIVDLTKVLSPSLVADVRASFGRYTTFTASDQAVEQNYSLPGLTMPFIPTTTHQNIAPSIAVTNYTSLFSSTANGTVNNYWHLSPSLAQVKGRHTLQYGFQFMDIQTGASGIPGTPNGAFTFNGSWSQQNPLKAAAGSGSGLADLLLGYPTSGSIAWATNNYVAYHYYAAYFQDDFKLSRNITLNLGLRWDVDTSPSERHDGINGGFCFTCTSPYSSQVNYAQYPALTSPLTGGLTFAGVSAPHAPYQVNPNNWQPRVGIAWAFMPKTVFRAGFGIYYNFGNLATTATGFSQTTSYVATLNGSVNPTNYFLSGKPYPSGVLAPAGASGGLATSAGTAITYNDTSGAIPWTEHWSMGFQRELPKQILLDLQYVGSHTHPINVSQPWDVIPSALQAACFQNNAVCNNTVLNPFFGVLPGAAALGAASTVSAWQLARPYPLFNGITQSNDPAGYAHYNALQVRLERRIKSVNFIVNYIYANDMQASSYLNSGNFRDATLWYGPWSNDQRHFFTSNAVWQLPIGQGGKLLRNAHGFLGALVNHWQGVSTFVRATGTPLAIPASNLTDAPGCTSYYPTDGQTHSHWINNNESCYQTLNQWQARTAPLLVGYLRNPSYLIWNQSLQKTFVLPWEGISTKFGIDCYLCSNTPIWGAPDGTISNVPTPSTTGLTGFGTIAPTNHQIRNLLVSLKIMF